MFRPELDATAGVAEQVVLYVVSALRRHIVMFALRPFWRWQTQGTYMLGFNAIMNWNDLDAGKAAPAGRGTASQQER